MTKLAGLIEGVATALQVPPSRIRTAAGELRKHKLLQTGPRGPGAPEMSPADAVNLLLAVMYDGELADAAETVSRLRRAEVRYFEGRRSFDAGGARLDRLPRNRFIVDENGEGHSLGLTLEILLDLWTRHGCVDEECSNEDDEEFDLDVVNLRLEVSCPGYRASLTFNTPMGLFWRVDYEWKSPEQIAYEEAHNADRFAKVWPSLRGPYMSSSRVVDEDSLTKVADCLRGFEWQDGFDEIQPPYECLTRDEVVPA